MDKDTTMTIALPSRLTSQVATEIYDSILAHLHSSKSILSKCSIVCKDWLPLCRRHLFFSLNLRPSLVKQLSASPDAAQTIIPHVRSIALGGRWINGEQKCISFIQNFERIEQLHLETWSLDTVAAVSLLKACSSHSRTLTILDLKYIRFPSFAFLVQFIASFVLLEQLSLDNVTLDDIESVNEALVFIHAVPPSSSLKRLSLTCCNFAILSWLSPEARNISSLHLPEFLPSEYPIIASFLKTAGSSLTHVQLGIIPHSSIDFNTKTLQGQSICILTYSTLQY